MSNEFINLIKKLNNKTLSLPELESCFDSMSSEYKAFVEKEVFINFFTKGHKKSFLWHDYETWGTNPKRDQASQFASIRTDRELNVIDIPTNIYCRPSPNRLAHPIAVQVTHLSPLFCLKNGMPEYEFFQYINREMLIPGTCQVAYNGINFDREVTRFAFHRNLLPAYEHEYANDNSVWDILMLGAMTRAVRPEGINWPNNNEGRPSLRLEDLAPANNIIQENAHNAVDDVKATIDWARLLKKSQPKLWGFLFDNKHKKALRSYIKIGTPYLYTNMTFGLDVQYTAPVLPLFYAKNETDTLICLNLREDFDWIKGVNTEELRELLYSKKVDLEESGKRRPPLVKIKLNKCPAIAPLGVINSKEIAQRIDIDLQKIRDNTKIVLSDKALIAKIKELYTFEVEFENPEYVEEQLYGYNFYNKNDSFKLKELHRNGIQFGLREIIEWQDERILPLIQRCISRSYPEKLPDNLLSKWKSECINQISKNDEEQPNFENYKSMAEECISDPSLRNEYIQYVELVRDYLFQTQNRPTSFA